MLAAVRALPGITHVFSPEPFQLALEHISDGLDRHLGRVDNPKSQRICLSAQICGPFFHAKI
jgi:hypothetical protein